jgi:hypothetical protein
MVTLFFAQKIRNFLHVGKVSISKEYKGRNLAKFFSSMKQWYLSFPSFRVLLGEKRSKFIS